LADLTHDAEDGFQEIHLTGKQLVFLFIATTVIAVIIFICGVLVGRGLPSTDGTTPVDDSISSASPGTAQPDVAAPAPAAVDPPAPAAEAEPGLTYKERLESPGRTAERLKPQPRTPAPERERPAAKPASEAEAPAATTGARPGIWVVQLVAIKDRAAATKIVDRLKGKGYPAFLVSPAAGSPASVFKVQVGRYAERSEAERVADRLKKEERFQPWIQR
jgi:DedD protein